MKQEDYHIEATFLTSSSRYDQCPESQLAEFAFIGRSNVGKSSLINMLVEQKDLAKTSSRPGKTQLINHFEIEEKKSGTKYLIADLPGYGYAKVSKTERRKWSKMIDGYLEHRANLMLCFVLIDSRHELQEIDRTFVNQMGEKGIPIAIILTKLDKLKQSEVKKHRIRIEKAILEDWEELPEMFLSSAQKKTGRNLVLSYMLDLAGSAG